MFGASVSGMEYRKPLNREKIIHEFISEIMLNLAPGIYNTLKVRLKEVAKEILQDPLKVYEMLAKILEGEEDLDFFDNIVALHVESVIGEKAPGGKVFKLLKEGKTDEFLRLAENYLSKVRLNRFN